MATPLPAYLNWTERFYRGETVRIASQLAGVAVQSITNLEFAMELQATGGAGAIRAEAALVGSVTPGQNGVQIIADPTTLQPPLPAGVTTYECVVESASLPAGYYRADVWLTWAYGRRVVSAGTVQLLEPALT